MPKNKTTTDVSDSSISPAELAELLMKSSKEITLSFDGSTWTLKGINNNDYKELRALLRSKTTNKE